MDIASLRIVWYNFDNVRVKSNCSRSVYPMGSKAGMLWQSETLPLFLN